MRCGYVVRLINLLCDVPSSFPQALHGKIISSHDDEPQYETQGNSEPVFLAEPIVLDLVFIRELLGNPVAKLSELG